ncbi:hypothetical protein PSAC2689_190074 [Paraburkholderia sacchari]
MTQARNVRNACVGSKNRDFLALPKGNRDRKRTAAVANSPPSSIERRPRNGQTGALTGYNSRAIHPVKKLEVGLAAPAILYRRPARIYLPRSAASSA